MDSINKTQTSCEKYIFIVTIEIKSVFIESNIKYLPIVHS